ncbi:hypothetical protein ASPBRDRAFT_43595 [Aspergillus brasiliensis CBS 101740]|uniref:Uncharacterized protein n=1 Tax=Aspergillus brasiliensis (strain CBS 101740 / IMI 381727 / IBT 21946) TaxID=767769 RepID=A0A1L9UKM8_ASPBC|nr:hypothetical protein ASPBRDRAFT_43595 [Aspergillus brasiliensis CBS 101740]
MILLIKLPSERRQAVELQFEAARREDAARRAADAGDRDRERSYHEEAERFNEQAQQAHQLAVQEDEAKRDIQSKENTGTFRKGVRWILRRMS